jgi:hypothetical protein
MVILCRTSADDSASVNHLALCAQAPGPNRAHARRHRVGCRRLCRDAYGQSIRAERLLSDYRQDGWGTQLQITAGEPGFSEEILEKSSVALGRARGSARDRSGCKPAPFAKAGSLLILAVDITGDRSLRDYDFESGDESIIDDPLVFLAQSDSLIIASNFAQEHGLGINSNINLDTMDGRKRFTDAGS